MPEELFTITQTSKQKLVNEIIIEDYIVLCLLLLLLLVLEF